MDKIARRNRFAETGEMLVTRLKEMRSDLILDLGCGENLYDDVMGVIGVDLDPKYADVVANIERLPYADESVDVILAFGSLVYGSRADQEHQDPYILLNVQLDEIYRVLKPRGLIICRTQYPEIITRKYLYKLSDKYKFKLIAIKTVFNKDSGEERLYWEWIK